MLGQMFRYQSRRSWFVNFKSSNTYGLPSLINKNIEVLGLENSVITTNLSLESIKNKIIEISKWSMKKNFDGKSISETINIKSSIDSIIKNAEIFIIQLITE